MLNTTQKKQQQQWELTNKALRYSYRAIWSIYFCSSTALISLPLPPVLCRETFLHFRDKNHSLLIHSSSFVSISHNKEITPTCDKSTHIHQTSLKSASDRKQKDDSFITEWAREHRSLWEAKQREAEWCGVEMYRPVMHFRLALNQLFALLVTVGLH